MTVIDLLSKITKRKQQQDTDLEKRVMARWAGESEPVEISPHLSERDHAKVLRVIRRLGDPLEVATAAGHVSATAHGVVYLRTARESLPLTIAECDDLIAALRDARNLAAAELAARKNQKP